MAEQGNFNVGCAISQRLTAALTGNGIPYEKLSKIIYGEMLDIALELRIGDWIEMPNGDTFTKTFSIKDSTEEN